MKKYTRFQEAEEVGIKLFYEQKHHWIESLNSSNSSTA